MFEKQNIQHIVIIINIITIYGVFFFTLLNFSDKILNYNYTKIEKPSLIKYLPKQYKYHT